MGVAKIPVAANPALNIHLGLTDYWCYCCSRWLRFAAAVAAAVACSKKIDSGMAGSLCRFGYCRCLPSRSGHCPAAAAGAMHDASVRTRSACCCCCSSNSRSCSCPCYCSFLCLSYCLHFYLQLVGDSQQVHAPEHELLF